MIELLQSGMFYGSSIGFFTNKSGSMVFSQLQWLGPAFQQGNSLLLLLRQLNQGPWN